MFEGVFKRALVGSLSINNHPYILTLEPSNEKAVGSITHDNTSILDYYSKSI